MENTILEKEDKRKRDNGFIYSTSSSDFLNKLGYGVPLSESFPPIQTPPPSPIKSDPSTSEEDPPISKKRKYLIPYSKEVKQNTPANELRAHLYPAHETIAEMEENKYNDENHPINFGGRKNKRTKKHKKSKKSKKHKKSKKSRKSRKGGKSRKHRKSRKHLA